MIHRASRLTHRAWSLTPSAPPRLVPLVLLLALVACVRQRSDDPVLLALGRALQPGDRIVLARVLDPDTGDRIAAVVRPATGKPELRIYERRGGQGQHLLVHNTQQGDIFHNLVLEDVNGDGEEEILSTWTGGHLEILEVIARAADGTYATLFQNAGQTVERRYGPAGVVEFWITSRTYEEQAGQPPSYDTTVYRWDGKAFSEIKKR